MKYVKITDARYVWKFPLEEIAKNYASYYAQNDPDTTYEEEYDFIMNDKNEALDWFFNNMDWEDVAQSATKTPLAEPEPEEPLDYDMTEIVDE